MSTSASQSGRLILWVSPTLIAIIAFFAAIPWLETLDDAVTKLIAAAVSLFVMLWALFVAVRFHRQADEVQRAGERYAFYVGGTAGWILTIVLLTIPPVQSLLIEAANVLVTGSPQESDRESMTIALVFGACLMVAVQGLAVTAANLVWRWRVGWR